MVNSHIVVHLAHQIKILVSIANERVDACRASQFKA